MALTRCKECGKQISSKADKCPHCGNPIPRTTGCALVVLIVLILIAIGWIATYLDDKSDATTRPSSSKQFIKSPNAPIDDQARIPQFNQVAGQAPILTRR